MCVANYMYLNPIMNGTTSMLISVCCGDIPAAVSPAYTKAPATPAAPVPELQVDTVFLQKIYTGIHVNTFISVFNYQKLELHVYSLRARYTSHQIPWHRKYKMKWHT